MKEKQDYLRDIQEIRSMMERSTKFLSLSGWAGIMAGIYALAAAWIAQSELGFTPDRIIYPTSSIVSLIILALSVLILSVSTAVFFSKRKAAAQGETIWNDTSRRLLRSMAIPLLTGGIIVVIFISKGLLGLIAPSTLVFYGLALYNAGNYTISEVKFMGMVQITLGLLNFWFIEAGLLFWMAGFGLVHLIYGIYMHFSYER